MIFAGVNSILAKYAYKTVVLILGLGIFLNYKWNLNLCLSNVTIRLSESSQFLKEELLEVLRIMESTNEKHNSKNHNHLKRRWQAVKWKRNKFERTPPHIEFYAVLLVSRRGSLQNFWAHKTFHKLVTSCEFCNQNTLTLD